jgi:hypothetical protein
MEEIKRILYKDLKQYLEMMNYYVYILDCNNDIPIIEINSCTEIYYEKNSSEFFITYKVDCPPNFAGYITKLVNDYMIDNYGTEVQPSGIYEFVINKNNVIEKMLFDEEAIDYYKKKNEEKILYKIKNEINKKYMIN